MTGGHVPALPDLAPDQAAGQRLDKWLWCARFFRHRADAQRLCESRHLRLDGRIIEKAHALVRVGSVLSFPCGRAVVVVRVLQLAQRRGSTIDAKTLFQDLSPAKKAAISATAVAQTNAEALGS